MLKEVKPEKNFKDTDLKYLVIPNSTTSDRFFSEPDNPSTLKYSKESLMSLLKSYSDSVSLIPIEKYEIDLYEISREFHATLFSNPIKIICIKRIHHLLKLTNKNIPIPEISDDQIAYNINDVIRTKPLLLSQYKLFESMLQIWNGLLVKWQITKVNNFEYRFSGRGLNVRMLDLVDMNKSFLNIDVIWIATQLFESPLDDLADFHLSECAKVLNDQIEVTLACFFDLNPRGFDPEYKIRSTVAYYSKAYRKFVDEANPEPNLTNYNHKRLRMFTGIAKCFWSNDQKLEAAKKKLQELEVVYRMFEKNLIARILNKTGKAKF